MSDTHAFHVLIRTDAGGFIGTGHVTRMLALAQAVREMGGVPLMVAASCPQPLVERLEREGMAFQSIEGAVLGSPEDAAATASLAATHGSSWIILDGYHFTSCYQDDLKRPDWKILCVDDYGHCDVWHCDALLNHNLHAPAMVPLFQHEGGVSLLGPRFALLRKEFLHVSVPAAHNKPLRKLLVTLGGVDPENVTGWVLDLLEGLPAHRLDIRAIIGAGNPNRALLEARKSRHQLEISLPVDDMPSQFQWADGVISAGGGTCLEWLRFQLPAFVVTIADNQEPVVEALAGKQLAVCAGWPDSQERGETLRLLQQWIDDAPRPGGDSSSSPTIDGYGARRVACFLGGDLLIRPALPEDVMLYFNWANDPLVRESALDGNPIPWEDHRNWFTRRLASRSHLFVCEDPLEGPIGQVRFDEEQEGTYVLDYSLAASHRGRKLASRMLEQALASIAHLRSPARTEVVARVKPWNEASVKALRRAGMEDAGTVESGGGTLAELRWLSPLSNAKKAHD